MSNLLSLSNSKIIDYVNNSDQIDLQENGKKLYNQNEYYQNIVNLMEHPEFRKLFKAHFFDWNNIKVMVMFMKLYEHIEKSTIKLNGYQKLYLLDKIMKTRHIRQQLVTEIQTWTNENSNKLLT